MEKEKIEAIRQSYDLAEKMAKEAKYEKDQLYRSGVALGLKIALDIVEGRTEALEVDKYQGAVAKVKRNLARQGDDLKL